VIRRLAAEYTVRELCQALEVSRSGYYAWLKGGRGVRARANAELSKRIVQIHALSRKNYGSPRVLNQLRREGLACSRNRVARLMRQLGLKGVQKGRFRPKTTQSRHDHPIAPNRLDADFKVTHPNHVWVADITYIPTREGWAYLSAFMDLKTRLIKGWKLSDSLKSELVTDAFAQAVFRHQPRKGLIVHSDRGIQYASRDFREQLNQHHALPSMSRKGNCYDNAAMESFWSTLKGELNINEPFKNRESAKLAIFDYIETFYNRSRLHSAIGYQSPENFEAKFNNKTTYPYVSEISG
jgi:transposase InsO family protein